MANRRKRLEDVIAELQARVEPVGDCLIWTGTTFDDGYPRISVGSLGLLDGEQRAHRVSWRLSNNMQIIPDGMQVCHSCDTPLCIKPDHLWLGTNSENMIDCSEKGRWPKNKSYNRGIVRVLPCEVCGEEMEDGNGKKKYCSEPCKTKARWARTKVQEASVDDHGTPVPAVMQKIIEEFAP